MTESETDDPRGYVMDVPYTAGYAPEHTANVLAYAAELQGYRAPSLERYRYCDLGCGRGAMPVLFAASNPESDFVGIDINPAHIEEAQAWSDLSELTNTTFIAASFRELLSRDDIEPFDFLHVHGVYSWVDDTTRAELFAAIDRLLAPGGLLFISYNALPGSHTFAPLRDIMMLIASNHEGSTDQKVKAALDYLEFLSNQDAPLFDAFPMARKKLEILQSRDVEYVAHEFFNRAWKPAYLREVAEVLKRHAGIDWIGALPLYRDFEFLCAPDHFIPTLDTLTDPILKQTHLDAITSNSFRRDIFIRPPVQTLDNDQSNVLLRTQRYATYLGPQALRAPHLEPFELDFQGAAFKIAFDALERTGEAQASALHDAHPEIDADTFGQTLFQLALGERVTPSVRPAYAAPPEGAKQFRLTSAFCRTNVDNFVVDLNTAIASPVLGTGFAIDPLCAMCLAGLERGVPTDNLEGWASAVLQKNGEHLAKLLEISMEELAPRMKDAIVTFREVQLARFVQLGVIEQTPDQSI